MFTTPDVNTMSEAQRDQIVSCIGGESIQPRDIGMDGIYLVGLAKSTDEPRCARWVAGTTENGCDVLFDRTAGTDGRLGVLIIKLVPGADTFERTFEPEQTAEGVNSLVYRICH